MIFTQYEQNIKELIARSGWISIYSEYDPTVLPRALFTFPNGLGLSIIPDHLQEGTFEIALMRVDKAIADRSVAINGSEFDILREVKLDAALMIIHAIFMLNAMDADWSIEGLY